MDIDDNSVNIDPPAPTRRPYHHGDLRDHLIDAAMRLLEQRHTQDVGLREVAREVGVSATAVYRHFADKGALLRAIAERGFDLMGEMQTEAAAHATGEAAFAAPAFAAPAFAAIGCAYVRFAQRYPSVFRLMFASAPPRDLFSAPLDELPVPMRLLRSHVAALTPEGTPAPLRRAIAIHAWSLVHGLAVLALDGMVEVDDAMIEAVIGMQVRRKEALLF
jgi:AcrR family transcriptional regulator